MDLSFNEGEVIDVLGVESSGWLNGCNENGHFGSFPKQCVDELPQSLARQPTSPKTNLYHASSQPKPIPPSRPAARPIVPVATRPTSTAAPKAVPSLPPRTGAQAPSLPQRPSSNTTPTKQVSEVGRYIPDDTPDIIDRLRNNTVSVTAPGFVEPIYWEENDMAELDEYARSCPAEYTHSIQDLAAYLTDPFPEPLHKIRAIFAWVTDNITYDVHSFLNKIRKSQQPNDVLKSRSSVCEGYARLTQALGEACHLPIRMVSGFAKGAFLNPQRGMRVDERGGHAWNSILLHGQYLMIDSTWGAGYLDTAGGGTFQKRFNPFFFLTDPSKLIYSHFPKDATEQYLNPPLTEEEYFDLPWTKESYHQYNLLLQSPRPRTPVLETTNNTVDIYIEEMDNASIRQMKSISGLLKSSDGTAQQAIGQRAIGYQAEGRNVWWIHVLCTAPGTFTLDVFVVQDNADSNAAQSQSGHPCLLLTVINHGRGSDKTPLQMYSLPRPLTILTPLYQNVPLGTERFHIVLPLKQGEITPPKLSVMSSWQDLHKLKLVKQESGEAWYESDIPFRQATTYHLCIEKSSAVFGRTEVAYICAYNPR